MTDRQPKPPWVQGLVMLLKCAAVVATLGFGILAFRGGGDGQGGVASATLGRAPTRPVVELSPDPGERIESLLARGGLGPTEAARFRDMVRPYSTGGSRSAISSARFHAWPGDPPERVELDMGADVTLRFDLDGAVWQVQADSVRVSVDTVVVSGRVEDSLWGARLAGDEGLLSITEKAALPGHLADVFAWQVDFYRDVRSGDQFRLALERRVRPDGSVRGQRVIAAEWHSGERHLEAYGFVPSDQAGRLFYDAEGTALKGAFLRAPLDLVRVTSRFSSSRYHPVLGRYRAHRGVDYGAASGTLVRATGDGIVTRAGWADDYGLMIELEHGESIRTRYAHLSGIADGLGPGERVAQGDPIGAVGATGLATGPHLHYEFLLRGSQVDPSSVDLPVERPLPDVDADRFARERFAAGVLMRGVRWPHREMVDDR